MQPAVPNTVAQAKLINMSDKIITRTPTYVNSPGIVRVDFWNPDFDALVDNKGYDVIWEKAVPCPCSKRQQPESICRNCQGTGWVFINPLQIKAVGQSINKTTKYKEWSQELLGTAAFTVRSEYHLNFMDKLTIINSSSPQSENLLVFELGGELLARTIYDIQTVREIYKYSGAISKLSLLSEDQFGIQGNFIKFVQNSLVPGDSITVTYMHQVVYYVLDLNHDIRNTITLDTLSREQPLSLPIAAIVRRAHNVLDSPNYTGDNLLDNSYL